MPKQVSQMSHFALSPMDLVVSHKDDPMAPMSDRYSLLIEHPLQFGPGLRASMCFRINNNPSLFPFSVPEIVLIFCQPFLFILQALQTHLFYLEVSTMEPQIPS